MAENGTFRGWFRGNLASALHFLCVPFHAYRFSDGNPLLFIGYNLLLELAFYPLDILKTALYCNTDKKVSIFKIAGE